MSDNVPAGATPVVPGATPGQTPPPTGGAQAAPPPATGDDPALGDAGKRAIDAMKAERDAAQRAAKAAERALEELKLAGASDAEKAIAKAKAEGASEVTSRFHDQIRRSEVKLALAAAGISHSVLDLAARADEFAALKVGEDGTIEGLDKAIVAFRAARADLFTAKRPTGSADAGSVTATGAAATTFTRAQLRDPKFYQANRAAIQAAQAAGRITG
jgi:hypothetical protein